MDGEDTKAVPEHPLETLPRNTEELVALVPDRLKVYETQSHSYFKYTHWREMWTKARRVADKQVGFFAAPYEVDIPWSMEPYFVVERSVVPAYDQHHYCFRDKAHHIHVMREKQRRWNMLPDVFIVNREAPPAPVPFSFPRPSFCDSDWFRWRMSSWIIRKQGTLAQHLMYATITGEAYHPLWSYTHRKVGATLVLLLLSVLFTTCRPKVLKRLHPKISRRRIVSVFGGLWLFAGLLRCLLLGVSWPL
jgi:hypothetical protein